MNELQISDKIESVLIQGDLSKLSSDECIQYYNAVCASVGLNNLTKPFEYIFLNGKKVLYATKSATDQLRKVHSVSITKIEKEKIDDLIIVTATAKDGSGREDTATGAVNVSGLKGEALANAMMKSETKAKRRVTLSICGLGLLDETEVADIPRDVKAAEFNNDPFDKSKLHEPKFDAAELLDAPSPGEFVATFGKFNGKKLSNIDAFELDGYCEFIKSKSQKENKPITGKVLDFMDAAEAYLMTITRPEK